MKKKKKKLYKKLKYIKKKYLYKYIKDGKKR